MINVNINEFGRTLKVTLDRVNLEILKKCKNALLETAKETAGFVSDNIVYKTNIHGQRLEGNELSTAKQKHFNHPLLNTGKMKAGIRYKKNTDLSYDVLLTNKADIYEKYLHNKKNWQIIGISNKVVKFVKETFSRKLNG